MTECQKCDCNKRIKRKAQTFLDKHTKKKKKERATKNSAFKSMWCRHKVLLRAPLSRRCCASLIESWDCCPCTHSSSQTPSAVAGMEIPQFPGVLGASQSHQDRAAAGAELSTGGRGALGAGQQHSGAGITPWNEFLEFLQLILSSGNQLLGW